VWEYVLGVPPTTNVTVPFPLYLMTNVDPGVYVGVVATRASSTYS